MTIGLIDKFLHFHNVKKNEFQLLGIACFSIATKYHDIYNFKLSALNELTANTYSKEKIFAMEQEIINKLNFCLISPNPIDFYNILSKMFKFKNNHYKLGIFFLESSLLDYKLLNYSASIIASSCIYIVMKYYDLNGYEKLYNNFINNARYPKESIKKAAREIIILVKNLENSQIKSVINKYKIRGMNDYFSNFGVRNKNYKIKE